MLSNSPSLPVLKIQRFSTQDGPGIRTTVFLQGCPLRCKWCHNPESQSKHAALFFSQSLCVGCRACEAVCPSHAQKFDNTRTINREACILCQKCVDVCPTGALERTSNMFDVHRIVEEAQKDVAFYGKTGGITLSGGEPLITKNALLLLQEAKAAGLHTAVETCGAFDAKHVQPAVDAVDLFLWDIKETNKNNHRFLTGVSNQNILRNLRLVDEAGGKTVLRCIMLRTLNTRPDHIDALIALYRSLKHCIRIEIFSYKHHAEGKYAALGYIYEGKKDWILPPSHLKKIAAYIKKQGVPCTIG